MIAQPVTPADFDSIDTLQPAEWGTIIPQFQYYLNAANCHPIKMVDDGKIIGVGNTILHKNTAWLSHIIVGKEYQGKGVGTTLTQTLINSVPATHKTILLVATPMGEFVYNKLGFETVCEYVAYKDIDIAPEDYPYIRPFDEKYSEAMHRIDTEIFGEDRHYTITPHLPKAHVYVKDGVVEGFYAPTFGEGLVIAHTEEAGIALLNLRLQNKKPCVFPAENTVAANYLQAHNYQEVKRMKKMLLGEKINWQPQKVYGRMGGNFG